MNRDWDLEFSNTNDDVEGQWTILRKHIETARDKWIPTRTGPPKWHNKGTTPLDVKCIQHINERKDAGNDIWANVNKDRPLAKFGVTRQ